MVDKKKWSDAGLNQSQEPISEKDRGIDDDTKENVSIVHISILSLVVFAGLYVASLYSYLLFHGIAEIFSISVCVCIFVIYLNARKFIQNGYVLFIGVAYFFVGIIDGVHTLAYKGMGVFPGYDANLPTQLWIAARYLQSLSLLVAPIFFRKKPNFTWMVVIYTLICLALFVTIFSGHIFPDSFIEGVGLTSFKIFSEYIVSFILAVSLLLLTYYRPKFEPDVFRLLAGSIIVTILSELAFTSYVSVHDFSNLLGHFLKILAFYLVYKALVETGLRRPYSLIFRELSEEKEKLQTEIEAKDRFQMALAESEQRYRFMVETANEGVWAMDGDFRTTFVNQKMALMLGYSVDEMLGRRVHTFMFDEDIASHEKNMELRRHGESQSYERPFKKKDGSTVWTIVSATSILDDQGAFRGSFAMFTDITERKTLEDRLLESETRYRDLWEKTPAMMVSLNQQGQIEYASDRFCEELGYTREEMLGKRPFGFETRESARFGASFVFPKFLETGLIVDAPLQYVRKDGRVIDVLLNVTAERDSTGAIVRSRSVYTDVTELKRAEKALQETIDDLVEAQKVAKIGNWSMDVQTDSLKWSDELYLMFQVDKEGFENNYESFLNVVHPEDLELITKTLKQVTEEGAQFEFDYRVCLPNGDEKIIHNVGRANRDDTGTVVRLFGTAQDVTTIRRANEELRIRDAAVENALAAIAFAFPDGTLFHCNQSFARMWGFDDPAEVIGIHVSNLHDDHEALSRVFPEFEQQGNYHGIISAVKRDGTKFVAQMTASTLTDHNGAPLLSTASFVDVTAQILAEEQLQVSHTNLQALIDAIPESVVLMKTDGEILVANKTFVNRVCQGAKECVGKCVHDIFPEEVSRTRKEFESQAIRGKTPVHWQDIRDGRNIDMSLYPVFDDKGEVDRLAVYAADITEIKRASESGQLLATVVEHSAESIVITDKDGIITYVNPSFERITGYSSNEVVGQTFDLLNSGQHDETFYQDLWRTISAGNSWHGVITNIKKDGSVISEDSTIFPIKNASNDSINYVAIKRDITVEMELQRQLQQSQKMEAVGTLAGGIAHDFNNILQIVLGFSELVLLDNGLTQESKHSIEKIGAAAQRGADLVNRLMTFSRRSEFKPKPLDMNLSVASVRKMLERTVPKSVEIELDLEHEPSIVNADPTGIDQILMNLAVNAKDAMPDGGKLTFKTANITMDEVFASEHIDVKPGPYVLLTVSDTGSGMDRITQEHIFEPFFTTKDLGKGTGLGLAVLHGIVKQHQGHVECESELGKGTTFKIYFPALALEASQNGSSSDETRLQGGRGTILAVDDEQMIRDFTSRMLTNAGYDVILACNGKDALEIYQSRHDEIDLVILDLMMPVMGGLECLKELLKISQSVKVVVASGHTTDGSIHQAVDVGAKASIQKPASVREVLKVVREVLDGE
jgi:two-component system, cell cycle sensor histidine kinase and response regulator CckA